MFSTCLFCHGSLGRNDAVEHFPVGRRLAFDPARGRLWAVCPSCARWNLTPLEERWEAIEECERLFPAAHTVAVTEQVSLARHRSGIDLVRIGRPVPREMLAWRWGRALRHRRLRAMLGDAPATALRAFANVSWIAGPVFWVGAQIVSATFDVGRDARRRRRLVTNAMQDGVNTLVRGGQLERASVISIDAGWALRVPLDLGRASTGRPGLFSRERPLPAVDDRGAAFTISGGEAKRLLSLALVRRNGTRFARTEADAAMRRVASSRSSEALVDRIAGELANAAHYRGRPYGTVDALSDTESLMLEMALANVRDEHLTTDELAALEAAWRDAEEVAAIADNLLLPNAVERKLTDLKR